MISLEQVKLLESKVTKAIDYVKQVTGENTQLKEKLDSYQKRIDELEVLIQRFKEDQGRIEDGILSALDRLNQFEDALEKSLSKGNAVSEDAGVSLESKGAVKDKPLPNARAASKKDGQNENQTSGLAEPSLPSDVRGLEDKPAQGADLKTGGELDIF